MGEGDGENRNWGKTVLGWFIQRDEPAAPDADSLIAKYANAAPSAPPVELAGPLPAVVDGKVEFAQVFEAAGVEADERGRVDKAKELLRSLPADTSQPVKRQIVEASLRAFGVPTEQIIEAAVAEIEALEAFIQIGQRETQSALTGGNERIADLERQVAEVRTLMQQAVAEQEARTRAANAEKLAVQQVLEFFGQDVVAKIVRESPKLHEPS